MSTWVIKDGGVYRVDAPGTYAATRARGLCQSCHKPAGGGSRCADCRKKLAERRKGWRRSR